MAQRTDELIVKQPTLLYNTVLLRPILLLQVTHMWGNKLLGESQRSECFSSSKDAVFILISFLTNIHDREHQFIRTDINCDNVFAEPQI